jgi:hypothetical protein
MAVLGLALNPRVHPDYRAFYIARTTTCLNRDRVGSLSLGETISFRYLAEQPERMKRAEDMKVCGWTGPVGDGIHSLGETSRLRVKVTGITNGVLATLEMAPVLRQPEIAQRVVISANGIRLHTATLADDAPQEVSFVIPQAILATAELLDIAFDFPDSVRQTPVASNIYDRAIKLLSFRLEAIAAWNEEACYRPDDRGANTHRPSTMRLSTGMAMQVNNIEMMPGRPSMPVSRAGAP